MHQYMSYVNHILPIIVLQIKMGFILWLGGYSTYVFVASPITSLKGIQVNKKVKEQLKVVNYILGVVPCHGKPFFPS